MMKKTLLKIAIGACSIFVLAAIVLPSASTFTNNVHSSVVYDNDGAFAAVERIASVRPPLAAPNPRTFSTDEAEISVVFELLPVD
jgi:hypothetical protein